jgi:lysophospholipase L1-like esterase
VQRVLLLGTATTLTLALGEFLIRLAFPEQALAQFPAFREAMLQDDRSTFTELVRNDSELFWRLSPQIRLADDRGPFQGVISNRQGLREDHEIPFQKDPAQLRILCLGDSCTFGYLLSHDQTYVEMLESRLQERCSAPVECINAGVPGYTSFQGLQYLRTEGLRYQPDLVILDFGWNEGARHAGLGDLEMYQALQARQPPGILARSRICQTLWDALNPLPEVTRQDRARLEPVEFVEVLRQIHGLLQAEGVDLLLLIRPGRQAAVPEARLAAPTRWHRELYRFGKQLVLEADGRPGYLDAVAVLQRLGERNSSKLLFDQVHPTARANAAIADALVQRLEPWLLSRID